MEKENTLCPTNVLESASVPGLMMLLATLIAGGIVLVIFYAVSRRSRTRQESQKPTYYDRSQFVPANSTTPMYIPPTPVTMQQPREFGKRARNKKRREVPQEREHRWTIGVMKGHTGLVNDMDFSSNGRFVASCADDENLRETRKHVQSAGQYMYKKKESKKKASSSLQTNVCDHTESQRSARREDKEAGRASRSRSRGSSRFSSQHGTVPEEPTSHEVFTSDTSSNDDIPDESQWQMMFLSDVPAYLASTINRYILSSGQLFEHGCPVESTSSPGYAIINNIVYPSGPKIEAHDSGTYSNSSSSDNSEQESSSDNEKNLNNENRPDKEKSLEKRNSSGNGTGRDSENSSDNEKSSDDQRSYGNEKSCDSESSSDNEKRPGNRNSSENEKSCDSGSSSGCENSPGSKKSSEHKRNCNRKSSSNNKNSTGDETCLDKRRRDKRRNCDSESSSDSEKSPGKKESGVGSNTGSLKRTCERCKKTIYVDQSGEYLGAERCIYHHGKLYNRMTNDSWYYTCCKQARTSRGCAEWKTHVWTGLVPGYNGPLADYVRTMPSMVFRHDNNYGIYAMDCEMCYTRRGLELARVSLVDLNGQIVYDEFVKPSSEVIDYNTRFSGITERNLLNATKTLPEVQNDLLGFICAETILMGHGLGNDLRALRMIHTNVLDTCKIHPHYMGIPYRNGLRTLARRHLNRNIQEETHDSIEDARVVVDLVWKAAQDELRSPLV